MDSNGEYVTEAETMALRRARSCLCRATSCLCWPRSSDSEPEEMPPPRTIAHLPQATGEGSGMSSQPVHAEDATAGYPPSVACVMPHPLASLSDTSSLPELVREFGQIMTKIRSPRCLSEPQHLQNQRKIFREWMQRDFSAFFSLKALQDAETALTKLYQAQQMTKVQYESFISFFGNLRALRDQYLKAERKTNKVRCYKEKHTWTSTTLQQLVEEGSSMEDRIIVVAFEIQKLEEQLSALKTEQMTLSSKLYNKLEEVKKVNHEVEEFEAQLANSNIALEEPGRIFTIMQTYHSMIAALAKDVKLLI